MEHWLLVSRLSSAKDIVIYRFDNLRLCLATAFTGLWKDQSTGTSPNIFRGQGSRVLGFKVDLGPFAMKLYKWTQCDSTFIFIGILVNILWLNLPQLRYNLQHD